MQRFILFFALLLAVACATLACVYPMAPVPGLLALGAVALVSGVTSVVVDALLRIAAAARGVEFELRTTNRTADQHAASVHRQERLQSETVVLRRRHVALLETMLKSKGAE